MTRRQHKPDDTAVLKAEYLEAYERTRSFGAGCKAVGLSTKQVHIWKTQDAEFGEALATVKEHILGELESKSLRRALGEITADELPLKVFKQAFGDGVAKGAQEKAIATVTKHVQGDPILQMFHLKKLNPEYREQVTIDSDDAKMRRRELMEAIQADRRRSQDTEASPEATETAADVDTRLRRGA